MSELNDPLGRLASTAANDYPRSTGEMDLARHWDAVHRLAAEIVSDEELTVALHQAKLDRLRWSWTDLRMVDHRARIIRLDSLIAVYGEAIRRRGLG